MHPREPAARRPAGARTASTMCASLIAGSPSGCVCVDYACRGRHVNCGITSEPMSSMVCRTLSWGTLYGLNRQNTMLQPVAS